MKARKQRLIFWPIFLGAVAYFLANETATPDLTSEVWFPAGIALLVVILMLIWYRLRP